MTRKELADYLDAYINSNGNSAITGQIVHNYELNLLYSMEVIGTIRSYSGDIDFGDEMRYFDGAIVTYTGSGGNTLTLPDSAYPHFKFRVGNIGSGALTLTSTYPIYPNGVLTSGLYDVVWDGYQWLVSVQSAISEDGYLTAHNDDLNVSLLGANHTTLPFDFTGADQYKNVDWDSSSFYPDFSSIADGQSLNAEIDVVLTTDTQWNGALQFGLSFKSVVNDSYNSVAYNDGTLLPVSTSHTISFRGEVKNREGIKVVGYVDTDTDIRIYNMRVMAKFSV